ncbi:MAG: DNA mismatch repair protein MutT [Ancylobacter novellus]|uniref:DNA mismatch repair protein MutT n=1 Tax=Ancylobacter novellus TaxID=921 RepID=A0A2W5MN36_ANCNO|nr:MAG: DNA mismatch repair protein MutT [Ancylobacter novellus]
MFRSKLVRTAVARWGRARRGMTLGVRIAACDEAGRVLLVRHGYAAGWHLPGGGVEVGETAETSARRELLEETGLRAEILVFAGLYFNPAFGGRDHVALFRAERFERGPEPAPNREIAERGWFSFDVLPEETTPATRRRLAELYGDEPGDGRW